MVSEEIKTALRRNSIIREMFDMGNSLSKKIGSDNVYDFSLGNPVFDPPDEFYQTILNIIKVKKSGLHRYISNAGIFEVRKTISGILKKEQYEDFIPEDIVLTVGAGGGLNVIFKSILNFSDEVITFSPYFMEYYHYINNHGGKLIPIKTDKYFQPQLNLLAESISSKVKAVLINSPNNPTGAVYSQEIINSIGNILKSAEKRYDHKIYLISDEPYSKLIYDNIKHSSIFKAYHNSILVTSHSKDYGLAGERIGYIAVSPKIANKIKLREALAFSNRILGFVNAPSLVQRTLPEIYKSTPPKDKYEELRDLACQMLENVGINYVKPVGAFYIFPKSPISDDLEFTKIAAKQGILFVPGIAFGKSGYFRLSYSVEKKKIIEVEDKLKKIVDSLS